MTIKSLTPAVVVGGELNGLGVVRSLAAGGVAVVVVETRAEKAAVWSRHATTCLVPSFEGRDFVDRLIQLATGFAARPVLLLTDEFAVHSTSQYRDLLAPYYRLRLPDHDMVGLLSDKARFQAFAEANAFPVPRTATLDTVADLERLAQLRYPAVIKPNDKRAVLTGLAERALRVASLREAIAACSRILCQPGGIVVQEWIEGPESNIYFTLFYRGRAGVPVSLFTGRKLLCFPRDVGSTALCMAAPQARQDLEAMTMAFADRAGFNGLGSMEYKWDDARGEFLMIEPTVGRTDWQEEIATLCGVNIPLAAYRHEMGLPQAVTTTPDPCVAWQASYAQGLPRAHLPPGTRVHNGYWRISDPLPAWSYYVLGGAPKRLFQRWLTPEVAGRRVAKHEWGDVT